jgi:hypothetical protein
LHARTVQSLEHKDHCFQKKNRTTAESGREKRNHLLIYQKFSVAGVASMTDAIIAAGWLTKKGNGFFEVLL